eukprot:COSAG01_NODE_10051_length_2262_cov_2.056403_2_plen_101_part_00
MSRCIPKVPYVDYELLVRVTVLQQQHMRTNERAAAGESSATERRPPLQFCSAKPPPPRTYGPPRRSGWVRYTAYRHLCGQPFRWERTLAEAPHDERILMS